MFAMDYQSEGISYLIFFIPIVLIILKSVLNLGIFSCGPKAQPGNFKRAFSQKGGGPYNPCLNVTDII